MGKIVKEIVHMELTHRILNIPLRFLALGMQFVVLCGVFKWSASYSIISGMVAIILYILATRILNKKKVKDRLDGYSTQRNDTIVEIVKNQEEILARLDRAGIK